MASALSCLCKMAYNESIRSKIRWLIISFTTIVSVLLIGLLIIYAWVVEDNIFNRMLQEEARYIEHTYLQSDALVNPRLPFMSLHKGWTDMPEHIQVLRQQSPERIEFPLPDGGAIHVREIKLGNTTYLLSANVTSYEISKTYLPKLIPWMLLVLAVMICCAYILARHLSRSVINPLQHIAVKVASKKDATPLIFDQPFASNEIGYLAQTVGDGFNRLQAALQRETDFSRDISHELRTPVAVLKLIAGRINDQQPLDAQSIRKVEAAINSIEQSMSVLLALSREESVKGEPLSLLREVEHSVINNFSFSTVADAELVIDIPATYSVICNQNLFRIMLNNLIENVVNHASKVSLQISLQGDQLTFRNPVEAVSSDDIFAPQVKSSNSQGMGQGLHLVQRICDKYGWQVSVNFEACEFNLSIVFA